MTAAYFGHENDHMSYENQGILRVDIFVFMVYMVLLFKMCNDNDQFSTRFDSQNNPHVYCLVAMGVQLFGVLCEMIHLFRYQKDGEGFLVMDIFGNVMDMISEVVMTVLVMMLANGWFTRFKKVDYDDHVEFYGPIMVVVGMIHIMLAALIYVD